MASFELERFVTAWLMESGHPRASNVRPKFSGREQRSLTVPASIAETTAKLLEMARQLPPGQERQDILKEIGRIRARIAAILPPTKRKPGRPARIDKAPRAKKAK